MDRVYVDPHVHFSLPVTVKHDAESEVKAARTNYRIGTTNIVVPNEEVVFRSRLLHMKVWRYEGLALSQKSYGWL